MKCLVVHGPNLNMLGKRNPDVYGSFTMQDINQLLAETYPEVDFTFYQSNHEGALIDLLQGSDEYNMLVINAGGLSHYSVSLRDAFELVTCKKAVVHLSDIEQRESFRHIDLLKPLADVYVKGLKAQSYVLAIKELIEKHLH
ncbi:type II 3-dehydroquinate dehydratase [Paracholeplasma manati]|uniref:3-dehydroquinate dehydratase n=1 Tax=Paracholeplasma manati TaxID=591373 RepID=A0ABT2Y6D4_9MOLU|nr:type II 3-dehydroquinate dehydratase [Paracholeplasma manati]MCV2232037.1 3-dehydroquinate dehydratase [Paracholeplasma manati]MDG0888809.1 3-dehydroquinate dehydratase [Paracholeplasma manati]